MARNFSRRRLLGYALVSAAAVPAFSGTALSGTASAAGPRTRAVPGEPAMNVLWTTDFSNGWDGWEDTPWNDEPQGDVARPTVVDSPTGQGRAARFHLEGGQKRNESQPSEAQRIGAGDVLIVRFTDFLADGFPVDTDDWQVVLQFKNDGEGSPPCEIKIGNGVYALDGNSGGWHVDIGPAVTGRPTDICVRITFSPDPGTATIDAWHNGKQTISGYHPDGAGTLYDGLSSYLKTGIYRSEGIGEAGTRFVTTMTIGTPA